MQNQIHNNLRFSFLLYLFSLEGTSSLLSGTLSASNELDDDVSFVNASRARCSPTSLPLPESEESGGEDISSNTSGPANAAAAVTALTYRTTPFAMSILDETEQNQVWIGYTYYDKENAE